MTFDDLMLRAEKAVRDTQRRLPAKIRPLAQRLPVCYHEAPTPEMLDGRFPPDILGLFVGDHHGVDTGGGNTVPPQILLFLWNILEEAERDLDLFHEEVRTTYLHELGHYLGWDEDEVEARGL